MKSTVSLLYISVRINFVKFSDYQLIIKIQLLALLIVNTVFTYMDFLI